MTALERPTRRRVVAAGIVAVTTSLAGCSDGFGGTDGSDGADGSGGQGFLSDYRATLDDELDIEIRELAVEGDIVRLVYDSAHPTDTEAWGFEIGFAAGRYGLFVTRGWETDRLAGTTTGTDGTTITWHIDAETAAAHANEEISTSEFVSEIFATMEEQ